MLKSIDLLLTILGLVLPYSQFIPFIFEHSLDIKLFFNQLFANKISGFFGMDVIVSSLVFWAFLFAEGKRLRMQNTWIYIAGNLLVGVSFGLPLFLYMRQRHIEQQNQQISYQEVV